MCVGTKRCVYIRVILLYIQSIILAFVKGTWSDNVCYKLNFDRYIELSSCYFCCIQDTFLYWINLSVSCSRVCNVCSMNSEIYTAIVWHTKINSESERVLYEVMPTKQLLNSYKTTEKSHSLLITFSTWSK